MKLQEKFNEYRDEGRDEGIALGEDRKQLEIATNMKKEGLAADIISKCTGLTLEQIAEL